LSPELKRARQAFPVTEQSAYLATGSWGPISKPYAVALRRAVLDELKAGRLNQARFDAIADSTERIRAVLAGLLGVSSAEIVLTRSTSASLEAVIREFPFEAGDEVVCTQLEHHACTDPLKDGARKGRFSVTLAQVPENDADDLRWLEQCVTARTRLIAFTGVSFETGQRLPIAQIGKFARERGIATLLDAAQWVGAVPLDLPATQIDYCAFPLQKWLCGPEGIGGLYVHGGAAAPLGRDRLTQPRALLEATAGHLEFLRDSIGWDFILERTAALAALARESFAALPGIRVLTPSEHAGLVTIEAERGTHAGFAAKLARRKIVVRVWPELDRYRLSTAFFNSEQEIARAVRVFA